MAVYTAVVFKKRPAIGAVDYYTLHSADMTMNDALKLALKNYSKPDVAYIDVLIAPGSSNSKTKKAIEYEPYRLKHIGKAWALTIKGRDEPFKWITDSDGKLIRGVL